MEYIGEHNGFATYFLDLTNREFKSALPYHNWFCCAIANKDFDNSNNSEVEEFIRTAIEKNVMSWHGLGQYGEKLHLTFDFTMVKMEVYENYPEIDVCTVGQNEADIADGFWGCFAAPCLPDGADYETAKLVCVSFDGQDYRDELEALIKRFNEGWLPSEK